MSNQVNIKFSIKNYTAIFATMLVLVMTVLDVTLVNVALPVMSEKFGVSDYQSVWIVTAYQLVITMLLLPVSSYGDRTSYRRCFLVGVAIFTISSALCAMSQSFAAIVVSRALQGVGAACVMGVNIALVRLIYPQEVLGRGLALNAMVIAIATAAGPTMTGAILSVASWHWLFLINVPLGIVAFIVGKRLLPQNPPHEEEGKFDWISCLENMVVFGLIFLAIGNITKAENKLPIIAMLAVGLGVGVFYVRRQLHRKQPMLPVDLLKIRLYTLSISTSVSSFIAQNVAMIALPFLFIGHYGFSEMTTGILMTPWPLATMIVSPIAARFVERHNPGIMASCGMAVYSIGLLLLIFAPAGSGIQPWDIAWRMAICGMGFGMFQTPNNIVMVMSTPVERTGGAGGMQSTARLVGQTLGATLVSLIFAMAASETVSAEQCLWVALGFAVVAGSFSSSRIGGVKKRPPLVDRQRG